MEQMTTTQAARKIGAAVDKAMRQPLALTRNGNIVVVMTTPETLEALDRCVDRLLDIAAMLPKELRVCPGEATYGPKMLENVAIAIGNQKGPKS